MTPQHVAEFCLSLPGAREDIKWGGVRVFSVAGSKMFALIHLSGADALAFKVDNDLFLGFCDRPGIHPAPIWPAPAGSAWPRPTRWAIRNCESC